MSDALSTDDFVIRQEGNEIRENLIKVLVYQKTSPIFTEAFNYLSSLDEYTSIDEETKCLLIRLTYFESKTNGTKDFRFAWKEETKTLHNLFCGSQASQDYSKFLDILYDISSKELLSEDILNYLSSYLSLKMDKIDPSNQKMITILFMLFHYYWGKDGSKINEESKEKLFAYFNLNEIERIDAELDEPFRIACQFLRKLLNHATADLKFKARDFCEFFGINLSLFLMISLCIDGISQIRESVGKLVLFVGTSGAGKSSTINYLDGVKYRLYCGNRSKKYYLKTSEDNIKEERAKVGHGPYSETLYPKVIVTEEFTFAETDGSNAPGKLFFRNFSLLSKLI